MDNFRGFKSTFLNLRAINFFVGENSTGKTSILKLIAILSSPGFWLYNKFGDDDETNFNGFSDLISNDSSKGFIEIGFCSTQDKSSVKFSAIKMKFIESNSVPQLKEFCYRDKFYNIQISIEGVYIKYRYEMNSENFESINTVEIFKKWIMNPGLKGKSFNKQEFNSVGISSLLFQVFKSISLTEQKNQPTPRYKNVLDNEVPGFLKSLIWIGANRDGPKLAYRNADQLSSLKSLIGSSLPEVSEIFKKFGTDSGLFDEVETRELGSKNDKENLFEIRLKSKNKILNIESVGYGVSQILPLIILPLADSKLKNQSSWFAIQAPEIHLHPLAQAAYGEFLFKCFERDNQKFIVETHSDYTIDRFRVRMNRAFKKDKSKSTEQVAQIVFFKKSEIRNEIFVIDILEDGSYSTQQPKEFKEFFIKEQLDLLNI